jgi:hypothetical protein
MSHLQLHCRSMACGRVDSLACLGVSGLSSFVMALIPQPTTSTSAWIDEAEIREGDSTDRSLALASCFGRTQSFDGSHIGKC